MHFSLSIEKGTTLMATDMFASMGQKLIEGNNFSFQINTNSEAENVRVKIFEYR